MRIAAISQGVNKVSLEGESRDQVVVTGDRIDSVCLTNKLRKKLRRHATLISVADVKVKPHSNEEETTSSSVPYYYNNYWNYPPPYPSSYHSVYDPYPNRCFIL
ncbi:hypothetical protein RIF29_17618 [Crotalaria pallida]|uniref:Heavy metal-associated isoprenylated plant protein 47-like n=1 Tax=Crotalaria pallida TaxID=3830 RepID=A0AAN9FPC9_CROPI